MRCVSCGADVPPQWVAAIESNVCPGCAGPIMTDDAQALMHELASAIKRMPNDPQGLTGWLLSNYKIQKIGTAEPTEKFHRPGQQPVQSPDGGPELKEFKVAQSPYDEYLARTNMKSKIDQTNASIKSKQDRMAQMAANISSMDDPYGDPPMHDISGGNAQQYDQEDFATFKAFMDSGIDPFNPSQKMLPAHNGGGGNGALSPEQIINLQKQASPFDIASLDDDGVARANVGYNDGDDLTAEERALIARTGPEGHKVVHEQRLKRIKAQNAIDMGGGSFTRAG